MKTRLTILLFFILLSFVLYWLIGKIAFALGNEIEGTFTRFAYRISFMIKAIGVAVSLLFVFSIAGMVYFRRKLKQEYYKGFLLSTVYIGVIVAIYVYLLLFKL